MTVAQRTTGASVPLVASAQHVRVPMETILLNPAVSDPAFDRYVRLSARLSRGETTTRVSRSALGGRKQIQSRIDDELAAAHAVTVKRIYDAERRRHVRNVYTVHRPSASYVMLPASVAAILKGGCLRCYALVLKYRDDEGACWPTPRRVAQDLDCDVRTARRFLARLRRLDLLQATDDGHFYVPSLVMSRRTEGNPPPDKRKPTPRTKGNHSSRSTLPDPSIQIHTGADAPACVVDHHEDADQEDAGLVAPMPEAPLPHQQRSSSVMTREITPVVNAGADSRQAPPPTAPAPPRQSVGRSRGKRTTTPRPSRAGAAILATLTSIWPDWAIREKDRHDAAQFAAHHGVEITQTTLHLLDRYGDRLPDYRSWDRKFSALEALKDEWRWNMLHRIDEAEKEAARKKAASEAFAAEMEAWRARARVSNIILRRPVAPPSGAGRKSDPNPLASPDRPATSQPAAPAGIVGLAPEEAA